MRKFLGFLALIISLVSTGCDAKSNSFAIVLNYQSYKLIEDETFLLSVNEGTEIIWSTSNSLVCNIQPLDENCLVEGIAVGSAIITADNGKQKASCLVNVEPKEVYKPDDPIYESLTLENFVNAIENSEPTKAVTNTTMLDPYNDNLTLSFTSTLVVDYSNVVKTMYTYSYQTLNEIDSDIDEFISTHSGVYYSKGSTIGEASENGIVWNNDFEGSINLLKFDLTKFETTPEISNNVVQGPVSTSFFKKDYSIENGQFYMVIEKDGDNAFRVRRTYLSFDMSDVYNGKTKTYNVVSDTKFTYKPEIIDYEW